MFPDTIQHTYTWSDIKVVNLAFVLPVVIFQEVENDISGSNRSMDGNDHWSGFGRVIGDNTKLICHPLDE